MADNCPSRTETDEEDDRDTATSNTAARTIDNNDSDGEEDSDLGISDTAIRTSSVQTLAPVATLNCLNGCSNSIVEIPPYSERNTETQKSSSQSSSKKFAKSVECCALQSKPETGACGSHPKPQSGMYLNGLVAVCAHNSSIVSSQPNLLVSNSKNSNSMSIAGGQAVHVNGNGAVCCKSDLSTDNINIDAIFPEEGSVVDQSEQYHCQRGARPKKLRRRPRRDDRHSKTGPCGAVQSDTDEDDTSFQNSIPLARPNVVACSRLGNPSQCNGEVAHSHPPSSPSQSGYGHHADNWSDRFGSVPIPVVPPRDEDLVDEGAVCDFDRNVLMDENLVYTEDTSIPSPGDVANERSSFSNGHASYSIYHPVLHQQGGVGPRYYSTHYQCNLSDSESELFVHVPGGAGGIVGRASEDSAEQDLEDNGDFIDADLPTISGQLLSSSTDSASLSSVNGELVEPVPVSVPCTREGASASSRLENDLSGGSDKELNHKQDSPPDPHTRSDGSLIRTSYSSPSHDGGFDNFMVPRDLSSSDGVFWNSSESENEDELSEGAPVDNQVCHETPVAGVEGAGVAEALVAPPPNDQRLGEQQFGAGGDLTMCFHFDRACCLQENQWPTASCVPHAVLAGQSASRHCPHPPLATDAHLEGEAGGACAPPPPVNNLSRLHPATPGSRPGEAMANGLDDVAPSNFINDESNRQQKVFDKFPMVEEGRDGACGSGAGQGKCDNDNVLYPCPVAPAPGILYERSVDRGTLQDQGTLGPNVESFRLPEFKSSFGDPQWRANSESGVSEPMYEESYGYRLCPSTDWCMVHNTLHQSHNKGGQDAKKKRIVCHPIENGMDTLPSVDRIMIWSEYEAYLLQVKQIGMSACGQTAVLNLLKAFELSTEKEDVCSTIQVRLRKEKASVAEYLASRAVAGTTAEDLLSGVERLTKGEIRGRFFQLWPPRNVQLLTWLSQWMKRGAVPIATLNLQQGIKQQQIPDAWHHQMVYGVGPRGVYLTNPLEIVPEETIMEQLMSDSVLLVRRQDVVSRFQPTASLAPLLHHPDPRWCTMNVLGQVVNVLREHNMPCVPGYRAQVTSHIRIPAVYRAGITLYVRHNTAQWKALRSAPDLPLLTSSAEKSQ